MVAALRASTTNVASHRTVVRASALPHHAPAKQGLAQQAGLGIASMACVAGKEEACGWERLHGRASPSPSPASWLNSLMVHCLLQLLLGGRARCTHTRHAQIMAPARPHPQASC